MKPQLFITVCVFVFSQLNLRAQVVPIFENFNYFSLGVAPLTSDVPTTGWSALANTCSPELDGSGRIKSKQQCSFGVNYAVKDYVSVISMNDVTYYEFKGGLMGSSGHSASAGLEISTSDYTKSFRFMIFTNLGAASTSLTVNNGGTGDINLQGNTLNLNQEYNIRLKIVWDEVGTFGKATLYHFLPVGKDPQWVEDSNIRNIRLPFSSILNFSKMSVYMTGSGLDLRSQIDDIYYLRSGATNLQSYKTKTFEVYPNPSSDLIYLPENDDWTLLNVLGMPIKEGRSQQIDLSSLSTGLYVVRMKNKSAIIQKQ